MRSSRIPGINHGQELTTFRSSDNVSLIITYTYFIFESLGTLRAFIDRPRERLYLLGPRRLPEMARKAGKIMNELRGTASTSFKSTWRSTRLNLECRDEHHSNSELDRKRIARIQIAR